MREGNRDEKIEGTKHENVQTLLYHPVTPSQITFIARS